MTSWGQDWPSPSTVVTPVYDGDLVYDGSPNHSHIKDGTVTKGIDEALTLEPEAAAKKWEEIDRKEARSPWGWSHQWLLANAAEGTNPDEGRGEGMLGGATGQSLPGGRVRGSSPGSCPGLRRE